MARPSRRRRICLEPEYSGFDPCGVKEAECVSLQLDEFEVIRLIDYEQKTQEEAARQMDISRTTVAEIYDRARYKLADCLINGKSIRITGGNYTLCDGSARHCCGRICNRGEQAVPHLSKTRKDERTMKIAVTYENGQVFQHFGHTEQFKLYEVVDGKVMDSKVIDTCGSGHGALAGLLSAYGVDTLICGGIGAGAQSALAEAGIQLFGGVVGDADSAVAALLRGDLSFNPSVHCDHHGAEHHCGGHDHGEGHHGCGGNGHCHH